MNAQPRDESGRFAAVSVRGPRPRRATAAERRWRVWFWIGLEMLYPGDRARQEEACVHLWRAWGVL